MSLYRQGGMNLYLGFWGKFIDRWRVWPGRRRVLSPGVANTKIVEFGKDPGLVGFVPWPGGRVKLGLRPECSRSVADIGLRTSIVAEVEGSVRTLMRGPSS